MGQGWEVISQSIVIKVFRKGLEGEVGVEGMDCVGRVFWYQRDVSDFDKTKDHSLVFGTEDKDIGVPNSVTDRASTIRIWMINTLLTYYLFYLKRPVLIYPTHMKRKRGLDF